MFKYILGIWMLIGFQLAQAQVEMADNFRGEGKIYVVVIIILVIMTGFFFLLFKLDKRTKRLEKEITEK